MRKITNYKLQITRCALRARRFHRAAETLLEAIVAISVFMIILGPASALYVSSIRTIALNRNDLVAAALAEEGVELMRNIRDTNVQRFSPKAEDCWNTLPDTGVDDATLDDCHTTAKKIDGDDSAIGSFYRLSLNPGSPNVFMFEKNVADTPELGDNIEAQTFYQLKTDSAAAAEGRVNLYFNSDGAGTATKFYREVLVKNIDLDGNDDGEPEAISVTSTVKYRGGAGVRTIQRALILTNQPT